MPRSGPPLARRAMPVAPRGRDAAMPVTSPCRTLEVSHPPSARLDSRTAYPSQRRRSSNAAAFFQLVPRPSENSSRRQARAGSRTQSSVATSLEGDDANAGPRSTCIAGLLLRRSAVQQQRPAYGCRFTRGFRRRSADRPRRTSVTEDGIDRGTAAGKGNVIPQKAVVRGDLRALTVEQIRKTQQKMRDIAAKSLPKTTAQIEFTDVYPPMPPTPGNRALLDALNQVNRDLGFPTMEPIDPSKRALLTSRSSRRTSMRSRGSACSAPECTLRPRRRSSTRCLNRSRERQC